MRRSLARDGFAVWPGPPAALQDRLRAVLGRLARRRLSPAEASRCVLESALRESQRGGPLLPGQDGVFILGEPTRLHPAFAAVAAHPRVLAAVARALGTRRLALHFANVTMKSARFGSGIAWHRDAANRYMPTRTSRFLRAMICLDGMTPGNGGTSFCPGSHRGVGRPAVVPWVPKGAMVLIHPRVLHGGAPNRSGAARRNLVVQWGRWDDRLATSTRESQTGRPPRLLHRPSRWLTG
ncbi:phytanoyl-CoA dioxygenase family protein [Falsiroseomonas sp.]|uniref:phytanoyl-CoA dioxygenase family protein n=1 Tax=Falsiroseomonas sp. TaxID=2870721 RepID=UPI0027350A3A|nr:phytanoyl-CoA dioxygenase family protein [Falsiroseomonas sp.]MDP3418439.1 phytanoyl-CoA dioxygenase family protein [Falsiroseomonas sp.]